jgi:hypothetical protein
MLVVIKCDLIVLTGTDHEAWLGTEFTVRETGYNEVFVRDMIT